CRYIVGQDGEARVAQVLGPLLGVLRFEKKGRMAHAVYAVPNVIVLDVVMLDDKAVPAKGAAVDGRQRECTARLLQAHGGVGQEAGGCVARFGRVMADAADPLMRQRGGVRPPE